MVVRFSRKTIIIATIMICFCFAGLVRAADHDALGSAIGVVTKRLDRVIGNHPALKRNLLADHNLFDGDEISTAPDGLVEFLLNDDTRMTLSSAGALKIRKQQFGQRYNVELKTGNVLVDTLKPSLNLRGDIVVKTDMGSVRSHAGKFWVGPLDAALTIVNLDGQTEIVTYGGSLKLDQAGQMVKLRDASIPPPAAVMLRTEDQARIMPQVTFPERWTGEK